MRGKSPLTNPIVPGFAPDPSVLLLNGTFFLVTSSFHLFPGLPIYSSIDLLNWKHIGNAINRRSQLDLTGSITNIVTQKDSGEVVVATGGLYAPTIRHHNGITYIVCTNFGADEKSSTPVLQNFIVSTQDIWSGQWSDPVLFDFYGIDPSIFFDDDGRSYIQGSLWSDKTTIDCFEIDINTGEKLSPQKTIWEGFSQAIPEGPHIYKKDSWYYLLAAEGGTSKDHIITMARSASIWGPYQTFDGNPILEACKESDDVQHTGHGDLFQDQEGRWWLVCLGVRKTQGRYILGRETFLSSVQWAKDEWPILQPVKLNPTIGLEESSEIQLLRSVSPSPLIELVHIRDTDYEMYDISSDTHHITLISSVIDLSGSKGPVAFVGKRQRSLEGVASVSLIQPAHDNDTKAGLAYYKDEHRYIRIFYDSKSSEIVSEMVNRAKSLSSRSSVDYKEAGDVVFRIRYTALSLEFSYSSNGSDWTVTESFDTAIMTDYDFTGPVIGVFATAEKDPTKVRFRGLEIL